MALPENMHASSATKTSQATRSLDLYESQDITQQSASRATVAIRVMAGAGRPSTTFLVASSVVVDGGPAPAMTAVGIVALLPDFTVSGLACKAAFVPPPLPLLSPLPPRIKASSQPHKRYGIKHDRANAAATQAVGGWRIVRRGSGGRRGRGDDFRGVQIQRLERTLRETRLPAWIAPD